MVTRKRLEVEIVADADSVPRDMRKVADATEDTADKMGKLDKAARVAFAVLASGQVLEFAGELLDLTVQMEAAERRTSTVFGDMAVAATEWAEANREAFGTSTTGVLQMLSAVGDLLVPLEITRDEALLMSQEILNAANAFSEWTGGAITTADAQERVTKALLGERDGLVELGIKINEADIARERARRGTEELTGAAEAQEDALITLTLIQQKGADALRAYAEGSGEATRASKELTSKWQTLKETAARNFGPGLADVAGFAADAVDWLFQVEEASGRALEAIFPWYDAAEEATKATDDLVKVTQDYGIVADRLAEQMEGETADAVRVVKGEFQSYTRTLYDVITAQASLSDPAIGAANAMSRLEEAQKAYQDVVADDKSTAEERREAALNLAEAQNGLTVALARVRTEGGQDAIDAFEEILRSAGVAEEIIRDLIQAFKDYNAIPVARKSLLVGTGDAATRTFGDVSARASGGPASGLTQVGEAGPEIVELPPGSYVHSASDSRRLMSAAGGARQVMAAGQTIIQRLEVNIRIDASLDMSDPGAARNFARQVDAELRDIWKGSN